MKSNLIEVSQTNIKLLEHVWENTHRDEEGRLVMPHAWNGKNSYLLSQNYNLSKQILNSTLTDPPNSSDFDEGSVKAVRKQPHRMAAKKCRELLKLQTD